MIAALYVGPKGVYADLPDVVVWDEARDARTYDGPWPVVAHPPCARWSRLAGFTEARCGYKRGEDDGCFAAALRAVRTWGGVLEHPAYSRAWDAYLLPKPQTYYGWTGGLCGGFVAYVEQGRYGLPVKKATWLYAFGVELPALRWGYTPDARGERRNGRWDALDAWRDAWRDARRREWRDARVAGSGLSSSSRTPLALRDVLLATAASARGERWAPPDPATAAVLY